MPTVERGFDPRAGQHHLAFVGYQQPGQRLGAGGFAAARGANARQEAALVEFRQGAGGGIVGVAHALDLDHRMHS